MTKLKSCPFCGGKAKIKEMKLPLETARLLYSAEYIERALEGTYYSVGCENENCIVGFCGSNQKLLFVDTSKNLVEKMWNRRADNDE